MTAQTPLPGVSRLDVGLAGQGTLRWVAVDLTQVLEEARRRLDLSPIAAVALGRALAAATLIQRISFKVPARLVLEVVGDGPLGKVVAESTSDGSMRGLVGEPRLPTPADGRMRIAASVGKGILRVTRETERSRYSSQVQLVSGELGDDVTHFLEQSEQIRSAVLLGALPRPIGIAAAGGLIVEALPGTEETVLRRLESNIRKLEGVSATLERGGPRGLADAVLDGFDRDLIDGQPVAYRCPCSREQLLDRLLPLAQQDLESVIADDGTCEAVCAFCGDRYRYAVGELLSTN